MFLRALLVAVFVATITSASSHARSPLRHLQNIQNPRIRTPTHRINALSRFDLEFDLENGRKRTKLSLEPNEDVIGHGATISYLDADGKITQSEPIDRLDHKVFRGTAWDQNEDGIWVNAGWARISVLRDGMNPLFEGAFSIRNENHHIQPRSSFMRTKHVRDPTLEESDDDYMVMFRDMDIESLPEETWHSDLKRDLPGPSCSSDQLGFNSRPDHPVYTNMMKRQDNHWGVTPLTNIFGKRQIDTQGSGNGAGVNLVSTIGQTEGCPTTRKVALVGVATDCGYTGSFNSTASARDYIITVMNSASYAWESAFNISLGLQNLTISDASCPGTVQTATPWNQDCDSSIDITGRLNMFSEWRGSLTDTNSHWTLLTKCNSGAAVGLSWLGMACNHDAVTSNSSTGVSETVSGANVVALTSTEWQVVAHETGHMFGAVHDCTSDTCASNSTVASSQCCPLSGSTCSASAEYIMNPYTSASITTFSPCTVGNICSAIRLNSVNTTCLVANKGIITISKAVCGNGIVEEGEECDCGGTTACGDNTCCDATTCKFINNAVCDDSNEDCCTGCQFSSNGTVCRASTGVCDPQETCTGTTAVCPIDEVAPNGQSCNLSNSTDSSLSCSSGQCTSRDLQCQTVMAGYFSDSSSTYACDSDTCTLSCASPAFGTGVCYGLQQNLLDGTTCGGGGQCSNGVCKGSNLGKEIQGWIVSHKPVVIGVAVAVGCLLLLAILSCCCGCARRRRGAKDEAMGRGRAPYMQNNVQWTQQNPSNLVPAWEHSQDQGWRPVQEYFQPSYAPPPPPYDKPPTPPPSMIPQEQRQFFTSPQTHQQHQQLPPVPLPHQQYTQQHNHQLYGSGILGARPTAAVPPPPSRSWDAAGRPPMPPPYPAPLRGGARYA